MAGDKKGGLFGAIAHELFEDDGASKAPSKSAATPAAPAAPPVQQYAPPPPVISGTTPYTFGMGGGIPAAPEAPDQNIVNAVNEGVFGGDATHYVQFINVWTSLGRPQDISLAIKAMQAMDKSLTAGAIMTDIQTHLSRLDQVTAKAASDFDAAAQQSLGGADQTIAQLNQANQNAQDEIARHQKETSERMAQIAQVTQQRATDEAAIARTKAQTEAAEASVKQTLLSMQAMLTSLPA